jgi:hypothetical protein
MVEIHDIKDVDPKVKGLPRPIAAYRGMPKPVPYSQDMGMWATADDAGDCVREGLCLVCGEQVDDGLVLIDFSVSASIKKNFSRRRVYRFVDLELICDLTGIVDNAPMHDRCAKLTAAHCDHVTDALREGRMKFKAYRR